MVLDNQLHDDILVLKFHPGAKEVLVLWFVAGGVDGDGLAERIIVEVVFANNVEVRLLKVVTDIEDDVAKLADARP